MSLKIACCFFFVLLGCGSFSTASLDAPAKQPQESSESSNLVLADSIRSVYLWKQMAHVTPALQTAFRTKTPPIIDGNLNEAAWSESATLSSFIDITGQTSMPDSISTTVQLMWDDDALYIGAYLREPHVWGTLTKRNSIIFHENDFEVFIDPDADFHRYHELEINALGTIWELTLMSPYRDGGPYTIPDNFPGIRTAVQVHGSLNDPSDIDAGWSVEIAMPWKDLKLLHDLDQIPTDGAVWKMNFSRVRWSLTAQDSTYRKTEPPSHINWTWSPTGIVDIHRPERWGSVIFIDSESWAGNDSQSELHQTYVSNVKSDLELQDRLMDVYYFAAHFRAWKNRFPLSLEEIHPDIRSVDSTMCYSYSGSADKYLMLIARRTPENSCPETAEDWNQSEIRGLSIDHRGKLRRINH